jgi:hypothetical protein
MEKNQGNLIIKQIKACPDFSGVQTMGLMQGLFPKSITNYESSITNRKDDKFVISN